MKTLVILGNDKIAGGVSERVSGAAECVVYIDRTTNLSRVIKLIRKRAISPILLAKMFLCELFRKGARPDRRFPFVSSNKDIMNAIAEHRPDRLLLFRAGLIINSDVIDTRIPVFNVHAAIVPDFGGIGSIDRALRSGVYKQYASLHVVTKRIDEGEVVDKYPYLLDPELCYCKNELLAYQAGQNLLLKTIGVV